MGLFDIFTGNAYKDAAANAQAALANTSAQQQALINQARTSGLAALQSGATQATGAIAPAIAQGRTDISSGMTPALSALYGGQGLASSALTGAVDPAIAALYGGAGAAAGAYNPLLGLAGQFGAYGTQAANASANALGLNGPAGTAQAQQQFQTGPGFQFALQTAIDAATRGANATGMGASGNTLDELVRRGTGLGQQEWNNYRQSLAQREQMYNPLALSAAGTAAGGISNAALQAGAGGANIYSGTGGRLADLFSGTGKAGAGIYTTGAEDLARLAQTGGLATADIYNTLGARSADLEKGLAGLGVGALGNIGSSLANTYNTEATGLTGASKNVWDTLGGGLKFAAGQGYFGLKPF